VKPGAAATVAMPVPAPIIVLFTLTAGALDAITFLTAHVFTANMTGNTVLLGLYLGQGQGAAALHSLVALGGYVLGVALGVVLMGDEREPAGQRPAVLRAVLVETVALVGFAVVCFVPPSPDELTRTRILVGCSAIAMGIQSAAVMRLQLPGLMTTYITGTITTLVCGVVGRLRSPTTRADTDGPEFERRAALQLLVFATYGLAALATAVLHARWPGAVALIPLSAITLVAVAVAMTPVLGRRGTR
jgi:uncharacterized membrane protein YoaK (UPF0700 family)